MTLSVALVQLDARDDVAVNIAAAVALADEAAAGGARLIALPEYLQDLRPGEGERAVQLREDICQALGVEPERKYQVDGDPSPADIARLMRSVMPAQVAAQAREPTRPTRPGRERAIWRPMMPPAAKPGQAPPYGHRRPPLGTNSRSS